MLHSQNIGSMSGQAFYDLDQNNMDDLQSSNAEDINDRSNTTPFSVRDILNIVDQNGESEYCANNEFMARYPGNVGPSGYQYKK
jgi:hypothetical protein